MMSRNPENNAEPWQRILGKYRYENLSPEDQKKLDALIAQATSRCNAETALWQLAMDCWTERIQDAFGTGEEGENSTS